MSGDGVPLGVVGLMFGAPDDRPDQGKTGRWLRGLRQSIAEAKELDGVKAVAVMYSERDVFDVFQEHRAAGCRRLALLVRTRHDCGYGSSASPASSRSGHMVARYNVANQIEGRPIQSLSWTSRQGGERQCRRPVLCQGELSRRDLQRSGEFRGSPDRSA